MSVVRKSSSSPEVKFTDFWKTLATTMKEVGYEITIRIEDAKIQRGHEESLCQAIISLMEALGENVVEFRLRLPFLLSEKTYLGRENFLQKISALLKKAQGIHISTLLLSQEVAEFIEEVGDKIVALQVDQLPNSQKQFLQKVLRKTAWLENLKLLASEFEQVPEEIYKLKVLSRLTISDNENIRRIPDKICSLEELSHLSFAGCENLSNFPECLCQSCGVSNINIDETNITKIPITCGRCELSIILPNGQEVQTPVSKDRLTEFLEENDISAYTPAESRRTNIGGKYEQLLTKIGTGLNFTELMITKSMGLQNQKLRSFSNTQEPI